MQTDDDRKVKTRRPGTKDLDVRAMRSHRMETTVRIRKKAKETRSRARRRRAALILEQKLGLPPSSAEGKVTVVEGQPLYHFEGPNSATQQVQQIISLIDKGNDAMAALCTRKAVGAKTDPCPLEVANSKILPFLVRCLDSPDNDIRFNAVWAFANLPTVDECVPLVRASGGMIKMLNMLRNPSPEILDCLLYFMGNLMTEDWFRRKVRNTPNFLRAIADFWNRQTNSAVQCSVRNGVTWVFHHLMHDVGDLSAEEITLAVQVFGLALQALINPTKEEFAQTNSRVIDALDGIGALVKEMANESFHERPPILPTLVQSNVLSQVLIALFCDFGDFYVKGALDILHNFLVNETNPLKLKHLYSFAKPGFIEGLVHVMKTWSPVNRSRVPVMLVMGIVRNMAYFPDMFLVHMANSDLPRWVAAALSHGKSDVRREAVHAVNALVLNFPIHLTRATLINNGLMPALVQNLDTVASVDTLSTILYTADRLFRDFDQLAENEKENMMENPADYADVKGAGVNLPRMQFEECGGFQQLERIEERFPAHSRMYNKIRLFLATHQEEPEHVVEEHILSPAGSVPALTFGLAAEQANAFNKSFTF